MTYRHGVRPRRSRCAHSGRAPAVAVSVLLVSACAPGPETMEPAVADSAGVRIVTYRAGIPNDLPEWTVAPEPTLVVGAGTASGDLLFRVGSAHRLARGGVAVANLGTQEILLFDTEGSLTARLGGEGQGPGEFTDLSTIDVLTGDRILAVNRVPYRIVVFDAGGLVAETVQPNRELVAPFYDLEPLGIRAGRELVAYTLPDLISEDFEDGTHQLPLPWGVADVRSGVMDRRGDLPGFVQVIRRTPTGGVQGTLLPFAAQPDVALATDGLYIAPGTNDALHGMTFGGALRLVVRDGSEAPMLEAGASDRYLDDLLSGWSALSADVVRDLRDWTASFVLPERYPRYRRVEVDASGAIWLERYRADPGPPVFVVLDTTGRAVARATLPEGLASERSPLLDPPMEIGSDYLLGVWTDALGVETVRLYALDRGAAR